LINANEVVDYLRQHPDFFNEFPESLNALTVAHPQDGRAVSLVERQLVSLREKNASLESKLRELIIFGSHNDVLADKLHRLTLALLRADDLDSTHGVIVESLRADFAIPQVIVRWWDGGCAKSPNHAMFATVSDGMQDYIGGLRTPYVGMLRAHESGEWLGEHGASVQSFAYAPLRTDVCAGVLMLASDDPQRFTPDMATDVLMRLSELSTVAIERFVDSPSLQLA
jgi:uncharacterized protein